MSNNNFIPIQPMVPPQEENVVDGTVEIDGQTAIDPDAADETLLSADADRIAAETADD